ncbi:MAG: hypothetical protein DHS20C14_20130 [Phycisphaeraceae bacterium]|nr:MAG: hypothetical protein DHS20C14_20130 [Phycisphaeraceae bacterium]
MRTGHARRRGFIRRSSHAISAALAATIILLAAPIGQRVAEACGCKKPVIRQCSPTVAMWKHTKRVWLPTDVVKIDFSWRAAINPPCPPGVICLPCPPITSASATFVMTPLAGGAPVSTLTMPIVVVDGVADDDCAFLTPTAGFPWIIGRYRVTATVDVVLADGTIITARGDTVVCIVDPAPGNPSLPRLDLENITLTGDELAHPGDPQTNRYRITNNDPAESVTIDLEGRNQQTAGIPLITPGAGPPMNPFSFSTPGDGDDYPISFVDPCILLPPDPNTFTNAVDTLLLPPILPGETVIIDVYSRGFQLCETGSGCEQVVLVDGLFSDGTTVEQCASGITLSDTAVPPAYACPDSGAVVLWTPDVFGGNPVLRANAQPRPAANYQLDYLIQPPQLFIDGNPAPVQIELGAATTDTCRITYIVPILPEPFPIPVDFFFPIDNFGGFPAQILGSIDPGFLPNMPVGFDDVAPTTKNMLIIDENGDGVEDSVVMNLVQVQAEFVCDPNNLNDPGQILDLTNSFFSAFPGAGSNTMVIEGQTAINPCFTKGVGAGLPVGELHITVDIRSFAGGFPAPPCFCDCDGNGVLNVDDVDCLVTGFIGGDLAAADCDGNGTLNIDDIDCFVACFLAGCP